MDIEHGTRRAYREGKCRCDECRAWNTQQMREYAAKRKERDGVHPTTSARRANGRKLITYAIVCEQCGQSAQMTQKVARFCSLTCFGRYNTAQAMARRPKALMLYVKPKREQPKVVHIKTSSRLTSGQCRVCSAWFVSPHLDVTCSTECKAVNDREAKHRDKARRRALKRDAFRAPVYRKKVFEADGYRCHLCNKKTDPTKVVPHPKAPTVDHVIPLARGGTHEPSNCRTACFLCNALKGDRYAGEQMLLLSV